MFQTIDVNNLVIEQRESIMPSLQLSLLIEGLAQTFKALGGGLTTTRYERY